MKTGLKKFVAALLAVVFLWSPLSTVQAQAGLVDHQGYMSTSMTEMPAMDGVHRTVSDMSVPTMDDMHCGKVGGTRHDCAQCNHCCASIAQYCLPSTAYFPGLMPTPAFFVAGIVIPTQDRPPRFILA